MDWQINTDAYELFLKIEVGVREFMIDLIKDKSVREWTQNFLGKTHLDSIKDIGKRIYESSVKNVDPNIEDVFINKALKEYKNKDEGFKRNKLFHPFYYLNWSDFVGILNKAPNPEILDEKIGKTNREVLIFNLKSLNYLRNDVAHSRFISKDDLVFIKSAYTQVCVSIPNFEELFKIQSEEEDITFWLEQLSGVLQEIQNLSILSVERIDEVQILLLKINNSFWANIFHPIILSKVEHLNNEMKTYKKFRQSLGGLLSINHWKKNNYQLIIDIKELINGR